MTDLKTLPETWENKLRGMLGARPGRKPSEHGCRNRYCAVVGQSDHELMWEMRGDTMTLYETLGVDPEPIVITRFRRESEMREPVKAWLLDRGFLPAVEFWLHGCGITDIVAGLYAMREGRKVPKLCEVVAVELKLSDCMGVLRQAKTNRHHCDWSFVAMPIERIEKMRPMTRYAIQSVGVGLIAVGDEVREVIAPTKGPGLASDRNQVKTLWRRVRHLS